MSVKLTNPKDIVGISKVPASCVSQLVMMEVGLGMQEGALKYGRHNYRVAGVRASVYYDATRRHIDAYWEGQDVDPDSGLHHVTKAITSLMVLRDAMLQGMCTDDRPPQNVDLPQFFKDLNEKSAKLLEVYKDRDPVHYTKQNSGEPPNAPNI